MSAGREVGGMRATCGRRGPRRPHDDAMLTREEREQLRTGIHDFARAHGSRVRPPRHVRGQHRGHKKAPKRTRRPREEWMRRFIKSYVRNGDMKSAAALCGVSYASVRTAFYTDNDFRRDCLDALSEWSGRMLRGCANGKKPWVVFPRTARALMRFVEKKIEALMTMEGGGL